MSYHIRFHLFEDVICHGMTHKPTKIDLVQADRLRNLGKGGSLIDWE
jgi:hypothetical protein